MKDLERNRILKLNLLTPYNEHSIKDTFFFIVAFNLLQDGWGKSQKFISLDRRYQFSINQKEMQNHLYNACC